MPTSLPAARYGEIIELMVLTAVNSSRQIQALPPFEDYQSLVRAAHESNTTHLLTSLWRDMEAVYRALLARKILD